MKLPTFPRRHPSLPETLEECDEAIAYWSALSEMTGLPVQDADGANTLDNLLDLRSSIANVPDHLPPPAFVTPPAVAGDRAKSAEGMVVRCIGLFAFLIL